MISGQITLNGITDQDLIMILQEKDKTKAFNFNPQTLQQSTTTVSGRPGVPPVPTAFYNTANLQWTNLEGLSVIREIMHKILVHHGHSS